MCMFTLSAFIKQHLNYQLPALKPLHDHQVLTWVLYTLLARLINLLQQVRCFINTGKSLLNNYGPHLYSTSLKSWCFSWNIVVQQLMKGCDVCRKFMHIDLYDALSNAQTVVVGETGARELPQPWSYMDCIYTIRLVLTACVWTAGLQHVPRVSQHNLCANFILLCWPYRDQPKPTIKVWYLVMDGVWTLHWKQH